MGRRTNAAAAAMARLLAPAGRADPVPGGPGDTPRWARPLSFTVDLSPALRRAWLDHAVPGSRVSRERALSVPAVKRVRDLIATTIGRLEAVELDPGWHAVENDFLAQPEADIPRSVTYTMTVEDMLFEGVGWWRITEWTPEGWPARCVRLEARGVTVFKTGQVYVNDRTGQAQGVRWTYVPDEELIRFDSPCAPLLESGKTTIQDALAVAQAASRNVADPIPVGYITPTDSSDPEQTTREIQEIVDEFEDSIGNSAFPYLSGGLKVNTLAWNPEQLQLNQTRDAVVLEVARMGGVDPEELGVSTTSRTYANAEQRRLDLLEFTVQPYLTAFQDRLSMGDVTFPGNKVRFATAGFLKADTAGRMAVYTQGKALGLYPPERLAAIEEIPVEWIEESQAQPPAPAAPPAADPTSAKDTTVTNSLAPGHRPLGFNATGVAALRFDFAGAAEGDAEFKVNSGARTITGQVVPWDTPARSGGYMWSFAPGSLHWSEPARVKLDRDHVYGSEFGRAVSLGDSSGGLVGTFKVARGSAGDDALSMAEDGVYDGLSIYVTFDGEGDGYVPHPDNADVRYVQSATLRKVALTAMPAFDDARVQAVAASQNGVTVTAPVINPTAPVPTPAPPFDPQAFAQAFTAGLAPAMAQAMAEALKPVIEALPKPQTPQRQTVAAGRRPLSVTEPMVYAMNGQGHSFVRDAWKARTEGDHECRDRVLKFQAQTEALVRDMMIDPEFALTTGSAGALIPPGFRPELYVTQLLRGRPLTNAISRGTLENASPFNIPAFVSSSGATADHVEGVNPSEGSMSIGTVTVSPSAISGLYKITREMADSANPAIDAIATQAMSESYSQQTEGKVYSEINGANGVAGAITSGFVPSGAQAATTTGQGDELGQGIRTAMALYPFRRFGPIDFGFLSQEGTTELASAVDTTGRPLFPWVAPQNPIGNAGTQGYFVDGITYQPAWSMTGNAAGDADVIMGARTDVWAWESPTLMFRFEERSGPAFVELALFGYFVSRVLRPIGLSGIRHTHT